MHAHDGEGNGARHDVQARAEEAVGGVVEIRTMFAARGAAEDCARALVDRRLAACVQVEGPVQSTYRWRGAVERAEEFRCTAKTAAALATECTAAIRRMHDYDTPEVLVAAVAASPAYAAWVWESVGAGPGAGGGP